MDFDIDAKQGRDQVRLLPYLKQKQNQKQQKNH